MMLPSMRRQRTIPAQWGPFSEFEELYERMGKLLGSAMGETSQGDAWVPLADVMETEDSYKVEVEVPGMSKDDIDLQMSDNELVITGETGEAQESGERTHRRTRRYGRFEYRTILPGDIDGERVSASLDKGILSITVPKSDRGKARRISIDQG
ncbi:Hsp20/alpha crystallin family protein [Nocardiopsis sp. ATB16-24]|uniref:Hsp20/alpha crystallin family protein n=1 Tax=Nocardiopsis sp. ATB16-24 TaxID=3019555 RepID=UPI0025539A81|nr:Hsp20/alpha crystallin family protein [Nocardiopsis sp. ATB16-24]